LRPFVDINFRETKKNPSDIATAYQKHRWGIIEAKTGQHRKRGKEKKNTIYNNKTTKQQNHRRLPMKGKFQG